jgi:hypothetical protein
VTWSRAKRLVPARLRPAAKRAVRRIAPSTARAGLVRSMRDQSDFYRRVGSPLYTELLDRAAADVEARGPIWDLLRGKTSALVGATDGIELRLLAAVHRLVLEGRAPDLARHYPTAGGSPGPAAWHAFRETIDAERDALSELIERPAVQHNEVTRCSVLIGGFLETASITGLPLRTLEVGASAGLNLRWPEYRYEEKGVAWGDPQSPVRLIDTFVEGRPPLELDATVIERRGCDLFPLDASSPEDCLSLLSFTLPDRPHFAANLQGALAVARRTPVSVDAADATSWLAEQLAEPALDRATVVFHSFVLMWLGEGERAAFGRVLTRAARRATAEAPLAHLSLEWSSKGAVADLTLWPGCGTRPLATTPGFGVGNKWLA